MVVAFPLLAEAQAMLASVAASFPALQEPALQELARDGEEVEVVEPEYY